MKRAKRAQLVIGFAASIVAGQVSGTPYFADCIRGTDGYRERVLQVLREAWPADIDPLAVRYAVGTWAERGLGLTQSNAGYNLVRLEFDASFWSSSFRDDFDRQDFENTDVRVASISIPISDELAIALESVLADIQPATAGESPGFVVPDGGWGGEIIREDGSCVMSLAYPEDPAGGVDYINTLLRYLGDELESWRWGTKEDFERGAMDLIREIRDSD